MKIRFFLIVLIPAFLLASTVGIYLLEYILSGNEESPYSSVFDSLWWTVVTFTTVGYGDMSPVTIPGRIFTFMVMAAGLINFSIVVSLVTDKFQQYRSGRDRGLDSIKIKRHVLICSDDPTWMLEIISQNKQFVEKDRVVLISPKGEHPLLASSYNNLKWVSGDAFDQSRCRVGNDRQSLAGRRAADLNPTLRSAQRDAVESIGGRSIDREREDEVAIVVVIRLGRREAQGEDRRSRGGQAFE